MLARFAAVIIVCIMWGAPAAMAQEVDRIAAVVNDEIISIHDLEARLKLALVMSGLPDNLENRRRAVPQVLRKMIDERLQLQEATRVKVGVTADEINRSVRGVEQQNRMPPGGLMAMLTKAGVDTDVARDQIRADLSWLKVTGRVLQSSIKVGEEEIDERLDTLKQQLGHPEFLLAEIFLNVDSPTQEEEARRLGERLQEQLKAGAPFQALARQFSQSASASNGGLVGWTVDSNLDDEIKSVVVAMNKGSVSPLIRTAGGFSIVAVIDKRVAGEGMAHDETVTVAQVFFPNPVTAAPREKLMSKAAELTTPLRNCAEFEEFSGKLNSGKGSRVVNVRKSDLPPTAQKAIADLPVNKASTPQDSGDGGLSVYMVCSRTGLGAEAGLPSRDVIRRQVENERMDLQSKRYLRDLRRAAFVDFRL